MKHILFTLSALFLLAACSSNENRAINEDVAAFVETNEKIALFGSINAKEILNKADYKNIDKAGKLIDKELKTIQAILNFDTPVYFAMEGTVDANGNPGLIYAFAEVKDKENLTKNLQQRGLSMEKGKTFNFHESGDVAFAVTDKRAVFVTKRGLKDGKKLIEQALKDLKEDAPENKVTEILGKKGDIIFGVDLEASFLGSMKQLKMEADKETELKELLTDSYSQSIVSFEKGKVEMKTENYLSEGLKKWMFFGNNSSKILADLGSGKPRAGIIMDLNMKKVQEFINKFAPNALGELSKVGGGQAQMALAFAGEEGLAGLWTGKMGFVMMGEVEEGGSFKPDFNFNVGLGKGALSFVKGLMTSMKGNMAKLELKGTNLVGASSPLYANKGKLILPKGCENFGKKPYSGFVNFNGLDMSGFDLEEGKAFAEMLDYAYFEMDMDGAYFILKSKNAEQNILKSLVDQVMKNMEINTSNI
ncbi:MAG: hypothetical protein FGM14_07800 [Flavobacteriales bacterium]|nr:hypothetical protein [Flavobacteriales bacterium]